MLYYAIVAVLMFLAPAISMAIDYTAGSADFDAILITKWYVFWAVGLRLGLAGLRQIIQPEYTAREILSLKSHDATILVRELGFANVAFGAVGIISLWEVDWRLASAMAGGIFYALAALSHIRDRERNTRQNVALVSDAFAALVLLSVMAEAIPG